MITEPESWDNASLFLFVLTDRLLGEATRCQTAVVIWSTRFAAFDDRDRNVSGYTGLK